MYVQAADLGCSSFEYTTKLQQRRAAWQKPCSTALFRFIQTGSDSHYPFQYAFSFSP